MKVTKKELKKMIKGMVEESLVQEAVITSGSNQEMYDLLSDIARLKKSRDDAEEKFKELKTEFSNKQKAVKKFLKNVDDKIAETNDVIVELKKIIKTGKSPSYVNMAEKLYEELKGDLKGFKDMAKTFIDTKEKVSYELDTKIKKGRRAKEVEESRIVEEGLIDGILDFGSLVKKNINKIGTKVKEWISLIKKNEKTINKAHALIEKANK